MSKIISILISSFFGLVFLLSAFAKLYPIELFEFTFVELGVASWTTAPFISRLLIGLEFFIGIALIGNFFSSRKFYYAVIALLLIFCAYLVALWFMEGNEGNCGCFGTLLPMTPLQAIVKNIVIIALLFLLIRKPVIFEWKYRKALIIAGFLLSFSLPFILNPVALANYATYDEETTGYEMPLESVYVENNNQIAKRIIEGKWIVGFYSLTCPHCKLAAYKFHILKEKYPDLNLFMVLNGDDQEQVEFFKETKSGHIPHVRLKGSEFIKLSGPELPKIFFINNKIVEQKPPYHLIDDAMIMEWKRE